MKAKTVEVVKNFGRFGSFILSNYNRMSLKVLFRLGVQITNESYCLFALKTFKVDILKVSIEVRLYLLLGLFGCLLPRPYSR